MGDRIVITGIGLISPAGSGKEAFWQALKQGVSQLRPVTLFDASKYPNQLAGEIPDFDPKRFLGSTGIRHFDRTSLLLASSTKLALEDAGYLKTTHNGSDLGIVIGSTFGSISSIIAFDSESVKEGPSYVNPMDFPNTVLNAPASRASIMYQIRGINATVSTGETSGVDAMIYACDFLRLRRAEALLAGGCYGLTEDIFGGFSRVGALAGSRPGCEEISAPFDVRRNGIVLGEASCLFLLERLEDAQRRKAKIYAEIKGYATAFTPLGADKIRGPKKAVLEALRRSSLEPDRLSCVFAGANSTEEGDRLETFLFKEAFADRAKSIPVSAVKSAVGECLDAGSALQVAAAVMALKEGVVPPTINYQQPDNECDLDYVPNRRRDMDVNTALISAFSPTGHNSFLVLSLPS